MSVNSEAVSNTSVQPTVDEKILSISTGSQVLNVTISFLTIAFNCVIIKCLLQHRSKFPKVFYQQTLCLSVTDLVAGFSPITSCFLLIEDLNRSFRACLAVFSLNSGAQLAVMINLCFLSIRRWIVLRHVSKPRAHVQSPSDKRTVLYILIPWIITAVAMIPAIRIVVFKGKAQVNGCFSINNIAQNDSAFLYPAFNIVSLALLTLFYIFSIISLKHTRRNNVTAFNSSNQRLQEKAFRHLIAVLVVANLTTLPIVINVLLALTNIVRNVQLFYLSKQLQALTTVINPLVYTFHVTEMKSAILETFGTNCRRGVAIVPERTGSNENDQY